MKEDGHIRQQKTGRGTDFTLLQDAQQALMRWIDMSGKGPGDYLFTSARGGAHHPSPLSRVQYARLIKQWAGWARLDPRRYSTHSGRRTKSTIIYERTKNLAACKELLGHEDIGSTARYLGIDRRQALNVAKDTKV